ncbi:MAG: hypothetical protein ACOZAL_01550 [Patescibacteria group bacterium]
MKIKIGKVGKGILGLSILAGTFVLGLFSGKELFPISLKIKEKRREKKNKGGV